MVSIPTNELGSAFLEVTDAVAVGLPTPAWSDQNTTNYGKPCNPQHALISVEGGDVRYRLDGGTVVEPFGILAKDGTLIDWTDQLRSFQSFIQRASFIATNGATSVNLNISWRN